MMLYQRAAFCLAFVAIFLLPPAYAAHEFEIRTVSSRADSVSGGSALAQLDAPSHSNWAVYLNNRDITASFRRSERSGSPLALVSGLKVGKNTLEVHAGGAVRSRLQILNHPISGPIFSGPHQQPFICQTESNGLGPALDADCAAKTIVSYYYKSTEPAPKSTGDNRYSATTLPPVSFKPYDPSAPRPPDLAQTVTLDGRTVDYVVRREVGVINRSVYEIQFIHEPGQPLPTPWTRAGPGWNDRLVYTFGVGCGAGYRQGVLPTYERDWVAPLLARGYAVATSSLNVLGNTCNDKVSAETASMVKEYFIKQFGEPAYTIGTGGSGGAVSVYLIAQNYPGILDGIIAFLSAPDMITSGLPAVSDCALLHHALTGSQYSWNEVQKTAISGYATWQACPASALLLDPTYVNPVLGCDSSLPKAMIYNRITNPKGARCTFFDNEAIVFGRDPKTGFARRTLDNVGIQYGLVAFNAGEIDVEQFIDLNARMGGFDQDGTIVPTRSVADPEALRAAYRYGVLVAGKTLENVPIIDWNRYLDDLGDIHTRDRAFATRARLLAANGSAANQVILVTPRPSDGYVPGVGLQVLVPQMDRWLANIAADTADMPLAEKIVRDKPKELADGCIAKDGERIAEPATYSGKGRCNQMYPNHGNPRVAAGAPIAGDVLKCALKPVDPSDYSQPLTPEQVKRLRSIFPEGVCDYGKPGIGEEAQPITWHVFAQ